MNKFRSLYDNYTFPPVDNYVIPENIGNNVLVDIGGCKGEFTENNRNKFSECFIFEASYENASHINKTILEKNWTNTAVFNLAVSDKTGQILKLYQNENDRGSGSTIGGSTHQEKYTNVYSIAFNDILSFLDIKNIDLLKIDCEGAEHIFLPTSNLESVDVICLELHDWEGYSDNVVNIENHILKTHTLIHTKGGGHKLQTYKRK